MFILQVMQIIIANFVEYEMFHNFHNLKYVFRKQMSILCLNKLIAFI